MPYASHPIHFSADHLPAAIDGWFDAMAAVHRTAPWEAGTDPRRPLFATLGSQDIRDAVIHPLGRAGPEGDGAEAPPGIALLAGPDDHEAWLQLEASGGSPRDTPGFARVELTFGPPADAHPDVRLELEKGDRGLGDAVPSVWSIDATGAVRPGSVDDLMIMEAVAAALGEALEASPADGGLLDAWRAGEPATRTARAGGEDIEVELSTRPLIPEIALPPGALLDALREVDEADDGWLVESRARNVIEHRLDRRFMRSPEAADLSDGTSSHWLTLAEWAATSVGATIASLDAAGLDEVVFDIVPRKVSADVDYARPFIECLRAFYRWLGREYAHAGAPECLAVLEAPDAVERLEALMADDTGFDPAKAMVMTARAAGIDPSTPEGMREMQAMMMERFERLRAPTDFDERDPFDDAPRPKPPLDPAVKAKRDAKRKAGRKAARKARKRSR